MRHWSSLLLITMLLLVVSPIQAQDPTPASARLDGMRHVYQDWNNCGPANLTMAMSYFGWGYDQEVAANWLKPTIEDKNVSPREMAGFVNQQTDLPIRALWRFGGTFELVKSFIANGFPVVLQSGYEVEDLGWMGHYETIVAYDDPSETFWIFDSYLGNGNGLGRTASYDEVDTYWRHFNRTFVVLFPLERETELRDLLGSYVDPMYAAEAALSAARQEAAEDPTDAWAWFNAGTSAVKLGRYNDAAIYFDEAIRQELPHRMLWYQFGPYEAYYNIGRYNDVVQLADATEEVTVYVEETYYWRGMALAALGRRTEAVAEFNEALSYNRNFTDAQTAITTLQTNAYVAPAAAVQ
jgi:tetratricopeptide (TPR) repeat protein